MPILSEKVITLVRRFTLLNNVYLVMRYAMGHKKLPNLITPLTFTEKTLCKMLFDRDVRLPVIADKLAVRDIVAKKVGTEVLTEIYAVSESELNISLDNLPEQFVLKANHGSKFHYYVDSATEKRPELILPIAHEWLTTNYGFLHGEWAYNTIKPKLFAEEYLKSDEGDLVEYKIFCFDGEPKFIKAFVRKETGAESRFFDLEWNTFEVIENTPNFLRNAVSRPNNFSEMIKISQELSSGFDFIRVDLYSIGGRIVFRELTNYHSAAVPTFTPNEYDYKFGSYWNLGSMKYLPAWIVGRRT